MSKADDLDLTVDALIDLDEPEALLRTLQRAADARSRRGARRDAWLALAHVLKGAEARLDEMLNPPKRASNGEPPDHESHDTGEVA